MLSVSYNKQWLLILLTPAFLNVNFKIEQLQEYGFIISLIKASPGLLARRAVCCISHSRFQTVVLAFGRLN